MPAQDSFPLIDRVLEGDLAGFLIRARGNGDTFQDIAVQLKADHDVRISIETVRRWCNRVGAEKAEGATA